MRGYFRVFVAIFGAVFAGPLSAADAPLLMKPPLPSGFVSPVMKKKSIYVKVPHSFADGGIHVACLVFDIDADGHTSNIEIIKSSGDPLGDSAFLDWVEHAQYQPATLNGAPIAVRLISERSLSVSHEQAPSTCSWDMLESNTATPKAASGQDQKPN